MKHSDMAKNILLFLSLGLACLGWGMWLYLDKRLEESEQRVEASLMQQIEYRRQAEEALKQKVESKRQAEEFMVQRDYQRQLEETVGGQFNAYKADLDRSVALFDETLKRNSADAQAMLAGFAGKIDGYKKDLEEYRRQMEHLGRDFEEKLSKKAQATDKELSQAAKHIDEVREKVSSLKTQLEEVKKSLEEHIREREGVGDAADRR